VKVRIVQIGARKNYVVPSALARADMLESLCTDFYNTPALSRYAGRYLNYLGFGSIAKKLQGRTAVNVRPQQVHKFVIAGLRKWRVVRKARRSGRFYQAQLMGSRLFCDAVAQLPMEGVDAIYAFSSAALEIFQKAKKKGILCILDHETAPAALEDARVREGLELFPAWAVSASSQSVAYLAEYSERQRQECELADLIIAPSTYCRTLIKQFTQHSRDLIETIPFAVAEKFLHPLPRKISHSKLRVLFVGDDALRKGLPVLVEALRKCRSENIEARGIGNWNLSPFGWGEARSVMNCLGPIPRIEIQEHFKWADVLVLPTFSDTMGVVILEAMASGATVITTPNSGGPDLFQGETEGFVVPTNDAHSIATRLEWLASDRPRLAKMQSLCVERVQGFSLQRYQESLIQVIQRELKRSLER
jgi:glycosyltransferase involved in cell wall biosynthesis